LTQAIERKSYQGSFVGAKRRTLRSTRAILREGHVLFTSFGTVLKPPLPWASSKTDPKPYIKRGMGSPTFAAQYQQSPVPPGGNMIDWSWFQWYDSNKPPKFEKIVISWTLPGRRRSFPVGTVWGEIFGFYYLIDVIREHVRHHG
jgi:hypothetical protein